MNSKHGRTMRVRTSSSLTLGNEDSVPCQRRVGSSTLFIEMVYGAGSSRDGFEAVRGTFESAVDVRIIDLWYSRLASEIRLDRNSILSKIWLYFSSCIICQEYHTIEVAFHAQGQAISSRRIPWSSPHRYRPGSLFRQSWFPAGYLFGQPLPQRDFFPA